MPRQSQNWRSILRAIGRYFVPDGGGVSIPGQLSSYRILSDTALAHCSMQRNFHKAGDAKLTNLRSQILVKFAKKCKPSNPSLTRPRYEWMPIQQLSDIFCRIGYKIHRKCDRSHVTIVLWRSQVAGSSKLTSLAAWQLGDQVKANQMVTGCGASLSPRC